MPKMSRVALVGAEFEESLAIRSLRAVLEAVGHPVVQVAFNRREELERAAAEVAAARPDVVGLSLVFTRRAREFADLAARLRELGCRATVVAGGHFAAFNAEMLLAKVPAIDAVAIGEGEEILAALAARPTEPGAVPGLVWRGPDGTTVRNAPTVPPADLDSRPPPVHREPFDTYLGRPIANLLSSRGCSHACAFCSIAAWHRLCGGERLRLRSVGAVADEMADLYGRGVRIFNFHDDNFFLPRTADTLARMRALRLALESRGVGRIAFAAKCRPGSVDGDLLCFMREMGLFRLFLGIEAGSEVSLRNLGRGQRVAQNERALAVVNDLGLHACFNLLMLNPDSTLDDVAANVAFLRAHPLNPMNFCRTEIYAGTPLEAKLRREGRLLGDPWGYDYRIADPRAQEVFDLVYPAFRERCFGAEGLHHLAMAVDYRAHLLKHFDGPDPALFRRAKAFVVRVNRNTCDHLEAGIGAIHQGLVDEAARCGLRDELTLAVAADDRCLRALGRELVDGLEGAAVPRRSRGGPGLLRRAAAGLLVTGALLQGCGEQDEDGIGTHVCEQAAPPPEQPRDPDAPLLADELTTQRFLDELYTRHGDMLEANWPQLNAVLLVVDVDGNGRVIAVDAGLPGATPAQREAWLGCLQEFPPQVEGARGKRLRLVVRRIDLEGRTKHWHAFEMAPAPLPVDPQRVLTQEETRDILGRLVAQVGERLRPQLPEAGVGRIEGRTDEAGRFTVESIALDGLGPAALEGIYEALAGFTLDDPAFARCWFVVSLRPEDLDRGW